MDPKVLVRRAGSWARLSENPRIRRLYSLVRFTYRLIGRRFPFLHLGWMASLRRVRWDGDDLVLQGWAFVRGADQGARPEFQVWLHRRFSPRRIHATVSLADDKDVLGAVTRAELDYSNMVFLARLDGRTLSALPAGGTWTVRVGIKGGGRRTWGPVRRISPFGSPAHLHLKPRSDDRLVGPTFSEKRGLCIVTRAPGPIVRGVSVEGREIQLLVDEGAKVETAVLSGPGQPDVELSVQREDDCVRLSGTLPPGTLVVDPELGTRYPPAWTAFAGSGRTRRPLTLLDDSTGHRPDSASTLLVRGGSNRALTVLDVPHFVEVDGIERVDVDVPHLLITGTIVGDPDAFFLVMSAPFLDLPVTLDRVQDGRFTATIPLRVSMWGGESLPPMRGAYDLEGRVDDEPFSTFVTQDLIDRLPTVESRPDTRLRLELARRDELRVRVTRPRNEREYGSYQQGILADRFARTGISAVDAVYLESFFGRNSTCNPRAIDREIARRRPDLPRYWAVDDLSVAVPEGATPVVVGSQDWWRMRESARWVVTNEWLRPDFVKKSFQTVLQTWHGSMYKKIGLDRAEKGRTHLQRALLERRKWDLFLSQNADTTPIIRRAYEFSEGIVESGYPRNDELRHPDPERVADIRARLGIPEGNTVVMYAPTWRELSQEGVELLDVIELSKALGPQFTFLQRGHVRTLDLGTGLQHDNVIDVSTYPQINDLYLAADLLITDYSSMMFDYSVTRRPMLFFTPDIDEYTDPKVRGVYFDLEEIAPGPVVREPGEVIDLLGSIDAWATTFDDRYEAWTKRFNHADDGQAAERAVDALFAFDSASRSRKTKSA